MKIIVVDDHALIIEGYRHALSRYGNSVFYFDNCKTALEQLEASGFDVQIAIIDILMSGNKNVEANDGEFFAQLLRRRNPDIKIIIISSISQSLKIYDLIKSIQPEGYIAKSECTSAKLLECIDVISHGYYRSEYVRSAIKEVSKFEPFFDNLNRQLLLLLSQGIKTKNLPDHLLLSLSAIDKRKSTLRQCLNIEDGGDEELLRVARDIGLIS